MEVIARGESAQVVIGRKSPGVFNMPGSVMFEVTGVVSLSRDLIPVSAAQTAQGEPPCVSEDCVLLPLFFWKRGDPGQVKAGLLFNAKVTDDVILNRELYLGRLEEVTEQEAKFRFDDVKPWTLFSNFYVGYDRKGKRPLIQFRERL